jgi:hypothetical protein
MITHQNNQPHPETQLIWHDTGSTTPRYGGTGMGNLLWIVIVILIVGWLLGFFAFNVGNLIHILLVIALILIVVRLVTGRRVV